MLAFMFERYRTLCSPFMSSVIALNSSPRKIHATLTFVTFFSLIFSFPRLYEFLVVYDANAHSYSIYRTDLINSPVYVIGYRIIGSLLFYSALPYILIFIMSFKVWNKIRSSTKARAEMNVVSSKANEKISSEKIFIAIALKFLISRFTSTSFDILEHLIGVEAFIGSILVMFCVHINNLIVIVSSALNFFIFCFFSKSFRKALSNLCGFFKFHKN